MAILTPIRLVIGFLLIAWLPGRLAWRAFDASSFTSLDFAERVFVSVFTSLLITAGLATLLAELGRLALGPLLIGLVLVCVAFAWAGGKLEIRDWRLRLNARIGDARSPSSILHPPFSILHSPSSLWTLGLIAVLILAAILFFHPAESVLVMDDAGVYVIRGLTLARTGQLDVYDPVLETLSSVEAEQLLPFVRYESGYIRHEGAFYIWQWGRGLVRPAFFHLPSIWMAVLATVGGPRAAIWATPLAGLIAVAGFALLARRLFGRAVGLVAPLLLTLSFPQVWYARYPTSEMFMQAWLAGGLFLLAAFLQGRRRFVGVAAGVALGQLFLIRVDAWIPIVAVGLCFAGWTVKEQRGSPAAHRDAGDRWVLVPLVLTLTWAGLHAAVFATPYVMSLVQLYLSPRIGALASLGVVLLGSATFVLWNRPQALHTLRQRAATLMQSTSDIQPAGIPASIWLIGAVVVGGAIWLGSVRSVTEMEALHWLHWYLAPLGLVAALAGSILMVRHGVSRPAQAWLLTALLYAVIYLPAPRARPLQPWGVRRFVPAVIPTLVAMMAYLAVRFPVPGSVWPRRAIRTALVLVLAFGLIQPLRPVLALDENAGAWDQVASLSDQLEPGAVVIFNQTGVGQAVAQPLTYLYDRPAFVLQTATPDLHVIQELASRWMTDGRPVYLAMTGLAPWLADLPAELEPAGAFTIRFPRLERSTTHAPREVGAVNWPVDLYRYQPLSASRRAPPSRLEMGAGELPYLRAGFHKRETTPDGTTFRWTEGVARLTLPVSSPEPASLALRASGPPPDIPRPTVQVAIDGQVVGAWELPAQFVILEADVPAGAARDGRLDITLRSDTWTPSAQGQGDDRRLGIVVDWIEVRE